MEKFWKPGEVILFVHNNNPDRMEFVLSKIDEIINSDKVKEVNWRGLAKEITFLDGSSVILYGKDEEGVFDVDWDYLFVERDIDSVFMDKITENRLGKVSFI